MALSCIASAAVVGYIYGHRETGRWRGFSTEQSTPLRYLQRRRETISGFAGTTLEPWAQSVNVLSEVSDSGNLNPVLAYCQFSGINSVVFRNWTIPKVLWLNWRTKMEERSSADVDFRRNNDDDDDDDKMIEGYNSSPSSSSSSINGTSLKSHQRKDVDDQLDEDDFERILSRSTARRLLALFEGKSTTSFPTTWRQNIYVTQKNGSTSLPNSVNEVVGHFELKFLQHYGSRFSHKPK